ncbi:MAG: tetratricopeptide repeat protein [Planctomycetes bacterium]|nr:tetratricopeptide repeat protein [Planctomycetota bacterium]
MPTDDAMGNDANNGENRENGADFFRPTDRYTERAVAWRWRLIVPVILTTLIVFAFMPALEAGFVYWDDDDLLLINTGYQGITANSLHWMFTTTYTGHFQPLTWLSYSIDHAVWGDFRTFGFHCTNVLLHTLTALSFYFVTRQLLGIALGYQPGLRSKAFVLSAGLAAALFAVHPLRVESVAWLAERRDVLSGFFFVTAVGLYLHYALWRSRVDTANRPSRQTVQGWLFYMGSVACCVLSLLSKASAMALPLVLLILDVYPLRRLGHQRHPERRSAEGVLVEKLPFFVLAVWAASKALNAQAEGGALYSLQQHDVPARIAQACYGLVFYVWKTVWPSGLGPLYGIPAREVLLGPMFWGSLLVVVGLMVAAVSVRRRWPAVPTALAAYAVILAPVLGLAQSGPQLVADRYSYLACMGFAILPAAWMLRVSQRGSRWNATRRHALLGLLAAVMIVGLEQITFYVQAPIWMSPLALWARGVSVSPDSSVAHTNFADALVGADERGLAIRHYELALESDPDNAVALHHLGTLYKGSGNDKAAISLLLKSLQIDPSRSRACYTLAELFLGTNRPELAVRVLRDGTKRNPNELRLIDFLARILASHPDERIRNGEEALMWASREVELAGETNLQALTTLTVAMAEAGQLERAIETTEQALQLAEQQQADSFIRLLQERLNVFREGHAYHNGP